MYRYRTEQNSTVTTTTKKEKKTLKTAKHETHFDLGLVKYKRVIFMKTKTTTKKKIKKNKLKFLNRQCVQEMNGNTKTTKKKK